MVRERRARVLSVLHVVAPARFGGLETVLRALASGHARRGHTVAVAVVVPPHDEPHPFADRVEATGVRTLRINVGDRDYLGEHRAIQLFCREHRPQIVHTHGYRSDVVAGRVARREGIATASTCHGFIESNWRGRVYQWIQRRALRRFDAVVAVSHGIEERLRASGVAQPKIHFVPNCYARNGDSLSRADARRLLNLPEAPVIGWVGRLSAEKGPDVALDAFARLAHPSAYLLLIGSGRDAAALRHRAVTLGVSDRVLWRDPIPDAGKIFAAFDTFLLSSRTEGTPMVLLEAMAAGVPIVTTRVGGVPEVVDATSAQLVDNEDVNQMVTALGNALNGASTVRAQALRARHQLDEHFAIEPWLSRYESIYRGILR
jgi:glycosyltransferase involved in cell wall biosynthesis